jgi:hypothetical protein
MNHKGIPDEQRSARCIIKDYLSGRLIYCYPPPTIDEKTFQEFKINQLKEEKYLERLRKIEAHVVHFIVSLCQQANAPFLFIFRKTTPSRISPTSTEIFSKILNRALSKKVPCMATIE